MLNISAMFNFFVDFIRRKKLEGHNNIPLSMIKTLRVS